MKSRILFLVLICLLYITVPTVQVENGDDEIPTIPQPRALQDNLMDLLLEIRKRFHMEIPSLGLPILEPARLEESMELNFEAGDLGILKGSFENLTIVGLQGFEPEVVNFKLAGYPFLFNITVPYLAVNGLYTIDSLLGNMLAVVGEGDFNVTITNLRLHLKGRLRFDGTTWTVDEFVMLMSLENLTTHFNGLYGGNNEYEDFINFALTKLGADILNEIYPDFQETFTDLVSGIMEGALVGLTVLDLMNIVSGNIDLPPLDDI